MQTKTLAMLGAVLAALVLIAWFSGAFESDPSTLDVPDLAMERSAARSIEIVARDFAVSVERTGGRWVLDGSGHPADSLTVRSLLNAFDDLEAISVVSRSPERYGRYGVDSTATYVRLRTDAGPREYWIGSMGPDARTGYVRVAGDERVFSVVPRITVPTGMNRWRDRRIFRAASDAVVRVDIETPDGSFAISRASAGADAGADAAADAGAEGGSETDAGAGWTVDTGSGSLPADSLAVARYLDRFDPFRVDGFLESFDNASAETHSLSVTMQGGSTWSLSVREQDGALAARVDGTTEPYRLLTSRRSELFPDPAGLASND